MTIIIASAVLAFLYMIYHRYMPVNGVPEMAPGEINPDDKQSILDVRHFQDAYNRPFNKSFNMPLAYLYRHYRKIGRSDIYIVASDTVEVNLSAKFLKRKGYYVKGYTIIKGSESFGTGTACSTVNDVCKEI